MMNDKAANVSLFLIIFLLQMKNENPRKYIFNVIIISFSLNFTIFLLIISYIVQHRRLSDLTYIWLRLEANQHWKVSREFYFPITGKSKEFHYKWNDDDDVDASDNSKSEKKNYKKEMYFHITFFNAMWHESINSFQVIKYQRPLWILGQNHPYVTNNVDTAWIWCSHWPSPQHGELMWQHKVIYQHDRSVLENVTVTWWTVKPYIHQIKCITTN